MDHWFPANRYRMLPEEMTGWCRCALGVEPVAGFSAISRFDGAREATGRVATYAECHDLRAWYLPLEANGSLSWQTAEVPSSLTVPRVAFLFAMGFGNGHPLPQPTGRFDVLLNGRRLLSVRAVKHDWTWQENEAVFSFGANRIESAPPNTSMVLDSHLDRESWAAFGPGVLCVPAALVKLGSRNTIEVRAVPRASSARWFQLASLAEVLERTNAIAAVSAAAQREPRELGGQRIFFGDIHTHSGESFNGREGCGTGTIDENYEFARTAGGLDFYALTDHEYQMDPSYARHYLARADHFLDEGRFVTLPAYEFTSTVWGHRNVYFRDGGGAVIPAHREFRQDYWNAGNQISPVDLWDALRRLGVPALTVPHHPSASSHPLTWDIVDPGFDRLVEIYSSWGSSDALGDYPRGVSDRFGGLSVQDALRRGHRLGFIASSDGHDGHPGDAQSPLRKHHHLFHPLGSGWAAVIAPALTRATVFDALFQRRCYATTGVPILLDFTVDGAPMGSRIAGAGAAVKVRLDVRGSNAIHEARVILNGDVRLAVPAYGRRTLQIEADVARSGAPVDYLYARVLQVDGESAWSSPVWVERVG